jgi:hypothetical protein
MTSDRIARDYLEQAQARRIAITAFYGNEAEDIPASELFDEADAERAIAIADCLLDLYARLLGENP